MGAARVTSTMALQEHLAGLPAHRWSRLEVAPGGWDAQPKPDFLFGPEPPPLLCEAMWGADAVGPVECFILHDMSVGPDGVLLDGGTALSTLATNHPADYVATVVPRIDGRGIRSIEGEAVLLSGPGHQVFGHWLVDFLPRLHVLTQAGHDPATFMYLVTACRPAFVDGLLSAFGIGAHQLIAYDEASEVVRVARLIVPGNLRRGPRLHPMFRAARDDLVARSGVGRRGGDRRLFVTRRRADPSRTLSNRSMVEAIAADRGFELVDPSDYTIPEQIGLFGAARCIAGEYGSGLHGSLFSPDGTAVCAIRGMSLHPGFIQTELAHRLGHRIGYVFGETPLVAIDQCFSVSDSDLRLGLACCETLADEHTGAGRRRSLTMPHDLWTDFRSNQGRLIHKWEHYFSAYERHFGPYRGRPILFIEIGCGAGGSLAMWKRYFGAAARIVGLDIRPECKAFEEDGIAVRIGDQADPAFLDSVLAEFGTPDIVLDDGSHVMAHVQATFAHLYTKVHERGVYAVEDLHTAYWPSYGGGLHAPTSFIELCKNLVDELNGEWTAGKEKVTPFTRMTASMHFYDSMVFFERAVVRPPRSLASGGGTVWEA